MTVTSNKYSCGCTVTTARKDGRVTWVDELVCKTHYGETLKHLYGQEAHMAAQQTKTGHTPGPWKVEDNGYPLGIWSGTGQTDGLQVCRIGGTGDCPEEDAENQANARLIAAAPKMLELLRKNVQPFCPVSVQDDIRAILARIDGEEGDDHA